MSYTEREPRKSVELEVQMKDFSFIKTAEENSLNLSQGGAFIRMDDPYPPGTLLKFKMKAPDEALIEGVAKVAWSRKEEIAPNIPAGLGIKFLKMNDDSRAVLEKLLETAQVIDEDLTGAEVAPDSVAPDSVAPPSDESEDSEEKSSVPPSSAEPKTVSSSPPPENTEESSEPAEASRPAPGMDSKIYNSKKTQTISFPPQQFIAESNRELEPEKQEADNDEVEPEESAETARTAEDDAVQKTEQDAKSTDEETASDVAASKEAVAEAPSKEDSSTAAGKSAKTPTASASPESSSSASMVVGILIVAAVAVGAWFLLGKDDKAEKKQPVKSATVTTAEPPAAAVKKDKAAAAQARPPVEAESKTPPASAEDAESKTPPAPAADTEQQTPPPAAAEAESKETATETEPQAEAEPKTPPPAATAELVEVEVITNPPGATVSVNGRAQDGVSPLKVSVEKGKEAEISARRAGWLTETVKIDGSEENKTVNMNLALARIKFEITSQPPNARILIDGKFNGKTPFTFLRKKYKPDYHYEIEKRGYKSVEGTVTEDDWKEDGRYYIFTLNAVLERESE